MTLLFQFFYIGAAATLYVGAAPFLLLLSLKQKYQVSIPARFFLFKNPAFAPSAIWFHAASLGEVKSLKPLIEKLDKTCAVSTVTQTGFTEAETLGVQRRFLPFEILLPFWIKSHHKALVVCEAELWYMLFWIAKRKGLKTYLINARISDRSLRSYERFGWLYQRIFEKIDMVFAQSQTDAQRLRKLGAKHVMVNGNIKAFVQITLTYHYERPKDKRIVTLASSHKEEESLVLEHLILDKNDVLLVVPRHPERFEEVDELLAGYARKHHKTYHRFSEDRRLKSDIVLVDMMGELINLYAISDIVLLGGSFIKGVGGHNPLEPAHFGCKIASGPYIFNQKALFSLVENIAIVEIEAINDTLASLTPAKITSGAELDPIIKELQS